MYVYTVDQHIFFSEKYVQNQTYYIPQSNIAVHFRPYENYDREYGIDWLRIGEMEVDEGAKYALSIGGGRNMENKEKAYKCLRNEYEIIPSFEPYYVPYLRLFSNEYSNTHRISYNNKSIQPTCKANVRLLIKNSDNITYPCSLKFDYDHELFEIQGLDSDGCIQLNDNSGEIISIKCIGMFACDQILTVWHKDSPTLIGALLVRANNVVIDRHIHIVQMETNIDDNQVQTEQGVVNEDEIISLCKFCYQGYVNPILHFSNISLNNDSRFKCNGLFVNDQMQLLCSKLTEIKDIFDALNEFMDARIIENDRHHSVIYVFKLNGTITEGEGLTYDIGIPYSIMLNRMERGIMVKRNSHSMAHEFFHGLGLRHTFDSKSKYKFERMYGYYVETNNLMSYEDRDSVKYLWDWQITEIFNKNTEK